MIVPRATNAFLQVKNRYIAGSAMLDTLRERLNEGGELISCEEVLRFISPVIRCLDRGVTE